MTDPATAAERHFREELMRCGALAISQRADGCVPKADALRIREIAYRACWPDDTTDKIAGVVSRVSAYTEPQP